MANDRFLDQENQPSIEQVQRRIGREVLPVWLDVTGYLEKAFPDFEYEWIFYNTQHGWALRSRKDARQLCLLFPERGAFTAMVTLDPEEDELALKQINYFNARLRDLLNRPSPLPHGRWLWMRLEDHTDFVGFQLLMEIKKT